MINANGVEQTWIYVRHIMKGAMYFAVLCVLRNGVCQKSQYRKYFHKGEYGKGKIYVKTGKFSPRNNR